VNLPAPPTLPPPTPPSPGAIDADVRTRRRAWLVAVAADLLQLAVLPAFVGGLLSPVNNVLDVLVALVMVRWFGWHWAFLPTFIAELIPGLDLLPSWTAAVWFVTRGRTGR